jgi:uncharacterized membrane protein
MARNSRGTVNDLWVRSWTKSFTWRVLGIIILILISYFITGSWAKSSLITIIFHGIRVVLYVLHERAWELTAWGRITNSGINMFWFYFWLVILILVFAAIVIIGTL